MVFETKIEEVFSLGLPIIDVRSPGEFEIGHIPGAYNISLFSNQERAHVGTVYREQSAESAIELGYKYVEPKLKNFILDSSEVAQNFKVIVYCWRGGMRSHSFAQHLSDNGFSEVYLIEGGYKAFRNHVLNYLNTPFNIKLLGGFTGSGKTHILHELKKRGHQVIDLEGLANHKGSAFGGIGQYSQPTTEHFENKLFDSLMKLRIDDPIWVEDESRNIGKVVIPIQFFEQMRKVKLHFIDIPKEERAKHLVSEYTGSGNQLLKESLMRISKRLGGQNVLKAVELLEENNYFEVAMIALTYYDKSYLRGMKTRNENEVIKISLPTINHFKNALELEKYGCFSSF
ncbi:MAG: tRNA 2-selenouridine(34) synthase MnmH [Bacteroidales bacterium]|nr:tRNA 2-selenouridine(34) synthase MnmH [Bacteroidales bacterium]